MLVAAVKDTVRLNGERASVERRGADSPGARGEQPNRRRPAPHILHPVGTNASAVGSSLAWAGGVSEPADSNHGVVGNVIGEVAWRKWVCRPDVD